MNTSLTRYGAGRCGRHSCGWLLAAAVCGWSHVLAAPPPAEGYLGSLMPVIRSIHRERGFPLEFSRRGSLSPEEWRRQGRAEVERTLSYQPVSVPLDPKVVSVVRMPDYEIRTITFAGSAHYRIPAYLLVPTRGRGPYPAVVALHDHGGWFYHGKEKIVETAGEHVALKAMRAKSYGGRGFANELARRGYVVIVPDAFYWGERRMTFQEPPADLRTAISGLRPEQPEYVAAMNVFLRDRIPLMNSWLSFMGTSWLGIVNYDDRRCVDLLQTLAEVDRRRIGCVGLSVGGYRATYLAGMEPRVSAAVIVGWMSSLPHILDMPTGVHRGLMDAFGLHANLDHPDVATLGAPATAILVQNCLQDHLFTHAGMDAAAEKIRRVYAELNQPARFRAERYDVPHSFTVAMQEAAFAWLDQWLKPTRL